VVNPLRQQMDHTRENKTEHNKTKKKELTKNRALIAVCHSSRGPAQLSNEKRGMERRKKKGYSKAVIILIFLVSLTVIFI
jgi:hypothetical protein